MTLFNMFFSQGVSKTLGVLQKEINSAGISAQLHTRVSADCLFDASPAGLEIDVVVALDSLDQRREFGNFLDNIANRYTPPITFHQYNPGNYKS